MKLLLAIFSLLFVCSCSMKENMEDMHDTTKEMGATTKKMKESTDHVEDRTEELLLGSREVMSIERQTVHLNEVVNSTGLATQLKQASIYFLSFEFQHWTGAYEDDEDHRQELMKKAVESLFNDIEDFVNDDYDVTTPFIPSSVPWLGNEFKNWSILSALSATMSKVHEKQIKAAKRLKVEIYSMYDILTRGLVYKSDYESGKKIPVWAEAVLENEQVAIYLLQLRHNFLPNIVAAKMSNIEDGWLEKIGHLWFRWQVDLNDFNSKQVEMWTAILNAGKETQDYLVLIGEEIRVNSVMTDIFSKLHFASKDVSKFSRLIEQLGVDTKNPIQHQEFAQPLEFTPTTYNAHEAFIVKLHEMTGSSVHIQEVVDVPKLTSHRRRAESH